MENLKVSTWNIKNSYFNLKRNESKASAVIQLLEEENLDILTLQEVNPLLAKIIEEKLNKMESDYKITSTYSKTKNPIKNLRVEYNVIISRLKPISKSTSQGLPYLPVGFHLIKNIFSIRKRNIVSQTLENGIVVDTTHLDHAVEELGKRQMDEVISMIGNEKHQDCDVILTGNLNKKPTQQNMIDFTQRLSQMGMQVVENPHKTYIGHNEEQPVDYIIVPKDYQIESVETLDNYDDISSHRPVVVETRKR